jgi:hypothetical protein
MRLLIRLRIKGDNLSFPLRKTKGSLETSAKAWFGSSVAAEFCLLVFWVCFEGRLRLLGLDLDAITPAAPMPVAN